MVHIKTCDTCQRHDKNMTAVAPLYLHYPVGFHQCAYELILKLGTLISFKYSEITNMCNYLGVNKFSNASTTI